VSRAVVVVTGVTAVGNREVLGCDVGDSEDGAFWTSFLCSLRQRGLKGVRLVISDHHLGLKEAIGKVFVGASWQRGRVHFMRNALAKVPKQKAQMVAAAIKTIFAQPDRVHIHRQLDEVADTLRAGFPDVARLLEEAKTDLLAFSSFPIAH
jgi:transposase-like protein